MENTTLEQKKAILETCGYNHKMMILRSKRIATRNMLELHDISRKQYNDNYLPNNDPTNEDNLGFKPMLTELSDDDDIELNEWYFSPVPYQKAYWNTKKNKQNKSNIKNISNTKINRNISNIKKQKSMPVNNTIIYSNNTINNNYISNNNSMNMNSNSNVSSYGTNNSKSNIYGKNTYNNIYVPSKVQQQSVTLQRKATQAQLKPKPPPLI